VIIPVDATNHCRLFTLTTDSFLPQNRTTTVYGSCDIAMTSWVLNQMNITRPRAQLGPRRSNRFSPRGATASSAASRGSRTWPPTACSQPSMPSRPSSVSSASSRVFRTWSCRRGVRSRGSYLLLQLSVAVGAYPTLIAMLYRLGVDSALGSSWRQIALHGCRGSPTGAAEILATQIQPRSAVLPSGITRCPHLHVISHQKSISRRRDVARSLSRL
jgi:hypothetical protein